MHPWEKLVKFCSRCGTAMQAAIPPGEDRERPVCPSCSFVHYENPRIVAGCIVEEGDSILMCKRAIEPMRGRWTIPGGYLELDESTPEGAVRETLEEADARVDVVAPHAYLDVPNISQVYSIFRARFRKPGFGPGPESLEVRMVPADEIPWDELSFPVVHFALRLWLDGHRAGRHDVHTAAVRWNGEGSRYDPSQYTLDDHIATPGEAG